MLANFSSRLKMSKRNFFNCCNILLCIILVVIVMYILRYTNVSISQKEGMKKLSDGEIFWIVVGGFLFMFFTIVPNLPYLLSLVGINVKRNTDTTFERSAPYNSHHFGSWTL